MAPAAALKTVGSVMSWLGIDTSVTRHGQRRKMALAAASKTAGSVMSWLGIDTSVDRQRILWNVT